MITGTLLSSPRSVFGGSVAFFKPDLAVAGGLGGPYMGLVTGAEVVFVEVDVGIVPVGPAEEDVIGEGGVVLAPALAVF